MDDVRDGDFDIPVMTETWLTGGASDQKIVGDVTPAVSGFHHTARTHRKGRGVGILICDSLKLQNHFPFHARSFENYQLTFTSGGESVRVAVVYHLHPSMKNYLKTRFLQRVLKVC